MNVVVRSLF